MDALLEAYPASFGQLMDAAVSRQQAALGSSTPALQQQLDAAASNNSSSSSSTPGSSPSEQERQQQGPQDNMAKLEELLQRQQQREQQQRSRSGDTTEGPAAAASASLAAAAARLEGLMAVSAVTPPGEAAAPPLKQQQSEEAAAAADDAAVPVDPVGDSLAEGKQPPPQPITPAAAAGDDSDESPMAKPQVVLVGATVSDDDVVLALQRQWVKEPVLVRVGEPGCVPAGLRHRAIVVSGPDRKLAGLVGSLRTDLTNALAVADAAAAAASGSGVVDPAFASSSNSAAGAGHAGPVRVIIFAPSEAEAQGAAEPLRSALWGDHMLAVLLPSSGAEPIKALHAFRDRVASLLLATPSAARGLDLPAVSHVYSLGLPQDVTEYVHRAGRAGRIGSTSGGEVCTVVTQEELPELQGMLDDLGLHLDVVDLGTQPGLGLLGNDWAAAKEGLLLGRSDDEQDGEPLDAEALSTEASQQDAGKLETARKGLEDLFNLL
jgi:Lhr-like helicase